MPSSDAALTRSLDEIAEQLDRGRDLYARMQCLDGRKLEGEILDVGEADLVLRDDATGTETHLPVHQLLTLDISSPRRAREWLVAVGAIVVVTAILVAFSRIPGVDPKRGDIAIGFVIVGAVVWALTRIPGLGKLFQSRLTKWDRVYPTRSA